MCSTPETIYLIPGEDVDGAPAMVWCDDPAPSYTCDPTEAVKYMRADVVIQQLEKAQARVAELEDTMESIRDIAQFPPADRQILKYATEALRCHTGSWLLRKQAEAIQDWLHGGDDMGGLGDYAQRLRTEAAEIERDGGSDA